MTSRFTPSIFKAESSAQGLRIYPFRFLTDSNGAVTQMSGSGAIRNITQSGAAATGIYRIDLGISGSASGVTNVFAAQSMCLTDLRTVTVVSGGQQQHVFSVDQDLLAEEGRVYIRHSFPPFDPENTMSGSAAISLDVRGELHFTPLGRIKF